MPYVSSYNWNEIIAAYNEGATYRELVQQFGITSAALYRGLRRHNVSLRGKASGPQHPGWKGGRRINAQGYVRAWIDPDDPMAAMIPPSEKSSHVLEHRLVMARHIGRPLRADETVHHINGDRIDNRIENLQLHVGKHGNGVVMCCGECGSSNIIPAAIA